MRVIMTLEDSDLALGAVKIGAQFVDPLPLDLTEATPAAKLALLFLNAVAETVGPGTRSIRVNGEEIPDEHDPLRLPPEPALLPRADAEGQSGGDTLPRTVYSEPVAGGTDGDEGGSVSVGSDPQEVGLAAS